MYHYEIDKHKTIINHLKRKMYEKEKNFHDCGNRSPRYNKY